MKFSISSAGLFSHLQAISRVIGSKNAQLPILDNFLFKIDEKVLTVTASDLDTTLITQIELEQVEGNGSVALSAKYLLEILKEFSDQPLEFVINDENLSVTIKSQNGSYNFIGTPGDEFPKVPKLKDNAKSIMYSASHLSSGLTKALLYVFSSVSFSDSLAKGISSSTNHSLHGTNDDRCPCRCVCRT